MLAAILMKKRLSRKRTVFEKVALSIGIFFSLSLPTPFGFLNFILIQSDHSILIAFQRVIHFLIIFFLVKKIGRDSFFLEFDSDNLYIIDKEGEIQVPLKQVYNLRLKPKGLSFNENSYKFELNYFDESGIPAKVSFSASPAKGLNQFIDRVKSINSEFKLEGWILH
jgi:hypothetical protein